jgi:hypothetical protein
LAEGKTESGGTDFSGAQILGAAAAWRTVRFGGLEGALRDGKKDRIVVRRVRLPGRESLWRQKPKGVSRMKQGETGFGWKKASRG